MGKNLAKRETRKAEKLPAVTPLTRCCRSRVGDFSLGFVARLCQRGNDCHGNGTALHVPFPSRWAKLSVLIVKSHRLIFQTQKIRRWHVPLPALVTALPVASGAVFTPSRCAVHAHLFI